MNKYQDYSITQFEGFVSDIDARLGQDHSNQLKECKRKGEEDGNRNLPTTNNEEITPFEKRMIAKYQSQVEELFVEGRQLLDEVHDRNFQPLLEKLGDKQQNEINEVLLQAEQEKNRKLSEEDENHKDRLKDVHNTPDWISIKKEFERIEERFKKVSNRVGREELHIQFRPFWVYIILIVGLGVAEIPLNNQVFLSFRETPLLTLIMSMVLVIALPFLAHGCGKFLKQGNENRTFYYLLGLSIILIVAISYLTAVLRTNYLATKGVSAEELTTDKWVFFVIGLVLFFVGMIASFFAHDASIEFTEVFDRFQKLKNKYQSIETTIHNQVKKEKERNNDAKIKIQEDYSKEKDGILREVEELKKAVHNVKGDYDKVLNYFRGLEKKVNQNCKEAIQHYRDTNLTYRNNHSQPKSWLKDIPDLNYNFQEYKELSENPSK